MKSLWIKFVQWPLVWSTKKTNFWSSQGPPSSVGVKECTLREKFSYTKGADFEPESSSVESRLGSIEKRLDELCDILHEMRSEVFENQEDDEEG